MVTEERRNETHDPAKEPTEASCIGECYDAEGEAPKAENNPWPMREDCERQAPSERATKAESCEGESRSSYRKLQIQLREAIAEKEAVEKKCDELRHVLDKACAQLEDNRQLLISAMEREDELISLINGFTRLLSLGRITQKN